MKRIVLHKPPPAKTLADFDLDDETIAKSTKYAHSERERVSDFAPSNARGSIFYFALVGAIREHLVVAAKGWAKRNHNGLEVVESAEKGIRVAYVATTGTESEHMKSSPRGPMSIAAAHGNEQLLLDYPANTFESTGTRRKLPTSTPSFETWFLAVERVGDCYLAALALPTEADGGRFTNWEQKIPIATIPLDSEPNDDAITPTAPPRETTAPPKARRKKKLSDEPGSSDATG